MKGLVFERNLPRFAASRAAAALAGSGRGAKVGPLRLGELAEPALPGPGWFRVRPTLAGVCGSDLATVDGHSSRYFEGLVSFPFVPGHEVVGVVAGPEPTGPGPAPGTRVVVEPVLGCLPRGIDPPCPACAGGHTGGCRRVAFGHLKPGLQIGYCADTGGGWSEAGLVAHASQLHPVPEAFGDDEAVMVEPAACAVHAALAAGAGPDDTVAVVGAGTLGLCTVAALAHLVPGVRLLVGAKHPHQRRLAAELGAELVVTPDRLTAAVRQRTRSLAVDGQLTGGADVVVDCVGSAASIDQALSTVRPGGRVLLVGMPGRVHVDLAPLWHREVHLTGAYAYGTERLPDGSVRRTFDLAFDLVAARRLGRLVSARYPLERYEEALAHAGAAGSRGAVKIVFDLAGRPTSKGAA